MGQDHETINFGSQEVKFTRCRDRSRKSLWWDSSWTLQEFSPNYAGTYYGNSLCVTTSQLQKFI